MHMAFWFKLFKINLNHLPSGLNISVFLKVMHTVKHVLSSHSKRSNIDFQDQLLLNAGQKYCRMLKESVLQYSIKIFVLSIFIWPFYKGVLFILTVYRTS